MSRHNPRNTEGIEAHAAARAAETRERVEAALTRLRDRGDKVTFASVARESGLSRSALYSNEFVKVRIRSAMSLQQTPRKSKEKPAKEAKDRIAALTERVGELERQKLLLIAQLVEMELIREENKELRRMLDARSKPQPVKVLSKR